MQDVSLRVSLLESLRYCCVFTHQRLSAQPFHNLHHFIASEPTVIHFYLKMVKTTLAPLYREWANNDPFLSQNGQNNSCTTLL
jgi:hypothetical protein